MASPTIKFTVDSSKVKSLLKPKTKEIARATRLVINKIVNSVHKDLGGSLPRAAGVQVGGFRRIRTKKKKAAAKSRIQIGTVWLGGNRIAAKYAGKARTATGGARAGRHFFKGAFVATMSNGYTSVFRRTQEGRLKEATVEVKNLEPAARASLRLHSGRAQTLLTTEINKIMRKKK